MEYVENSLILDEVSSGIRSFDCPSLQKLEDSPLPLRFELCYNRLVQQGPIAQRLEQPAHKSAHALLRIMPAVAGGTEVKVSKAGSYLDGKPERDNSMTCKSLVGRSGSYAVHG